MDRKIISQLKDELGNLEWLLSEDNNIADEEAHQNAIAESYQQIDQLSNKLCAGKVNRYNVAALARSGINPDLTIKTN